MCVRARKVILPGLSRNGPTGLLITSLILMTDCSENTFCFKIYRHSVSVFFFFRSTELHEVNNYDTNLSTEAHVSTPRYGPVPYFVRITTNHHGKLAPDEKSHFFC